MTRKTQIGAFVFDEDLTYWWTCYGYHPDGKGGAVKVKFQAEFEHLSISEREQAAKEYRERMEEIGEARKRLADGEDVDDVDTEADIERLARQLGTFQQVLLRKVTRKLRGLVDGKGQDLAFDSDDPLFDRFLDYPWGRQALWDGFQKSQQSRKPEGN